MKAYLIFVTSTTSGACGDKICHVEKFSTVMWRTFHITDCHVEKYLVRVNVEKNLSNRGIFQHEKCGQQSVLSQFMLFSCKICFVTIYAVLSQNLFCRDLCAFAWRKVETKNCVCGEKRTNIMYVHCTTTTVLLAHFLINSLKWAVLLLCDSSPSLKQNVI